MTITKDLLAPSLGCLLCLAHGAFALLCPWW